MNSDVHTNICMNINLFLRNKYPGVQLLSHAVATCSVFKQSVKIFQVDVTSDIPTNNTLVNQVFFHILARI